MKKIISIYSILVFITGSFCKIFAQQVVYYQEEKLYTIKPETLKKTSLKLEKGMSIDNTKLSKTDKIVYRSELISAMLKLPENSLFYQGLQSPYDKAVWIFVERDMIGTGYRMWKFNTNTSRQDLIFENANGPNPKFQFVPIAWSNDSDVIYLEAIDHFDSENLHEGIYSYHLKKGESQKLAVKDHYITTPLLSSNRKTFAYSASFESGKHRDLLHGMSERLLIYNVKTNMEKIIVEKKGSSFFCAGWIASQISPKSILIKKEKDKDETINTKAQVSLKLPWNSGVRYCISRHGTPVPTGPIGSSSRCNIYNFNSHGYVAIDVDTPNAVVDDILASAAGTVTFARTTDQGGYGKYVIITHDDNSQTLYAHLSRVYVNVGDCVGQGNPIGDGGTTGNSSGDHLHFEKRVGGTKEYPVFSECGCTPRQDYGYTSRNQKTTGCGPSCKPDITVSGTINSGTYTSSSTITGSGVINVGNTVVFDTKNEINLIQGFEVKSNSAFEAKVGNGCVNSRSFETSASTKRIKTINESFKVYPNPSKGIIYVEGATTNDIISLYDISGRLLIKKVTSKTREQLDIKHLLQGLYIVKVGSKTAKQVFKVD